MARCACAAAAAKNVWEQLMHSWWVFAVSEAVCKACDVERLDYSRHCTNGRLPTR